METPRDIVREILVVLLADIRQLGRAMLVSKLFHSVSLEIYPSVLRGQMRGVEAFIEHVKAAAEVNEKVSPSIYVMHPSNKLGFRVGYTIVCAGGGHHVI